MDNGESGSKVWGGGDGRRYPSLPRIGGFSVLEFWCVCVCDGYWLGFLVMHVHVVPSGDLLFLLATLPVSFSICYSLSFNFFLVGFPLSIEFVLCLFYGFEFCHDIR